MTPQVAERERIAKWHDEQAKADGLVADLCTGEKKRAIRSREMAHRESALAIRAMTDEGEQS